MILYPSLPDGQTAYPYRCDDMAARGFPVSAKPPAGDRPACGAKHRKK